MLVTDLNHFAGLPEDTPGPARRLAEHLSNIVRAATAGDAGTAWETALPCRRRPANRRCPGRMIVLRTAAGAPIRWQCSVTSTPHAWCDLVFLTIAGSDDCACLLADPLTCEDAFRELMAWSLTGRVPLRYSRYVLSRPLMTDLGLAERVTGVLGAIRPDLLSRLT